MKKYKIAITGPESTGKTTLAEQLARYFQAVWVPEFARTYIERLNRFYTYDDILTIAQGQMQWEDEASAKHQLVFLDTELLVTKIWCEYKYGTCHRWIIDELKKRTYDLVLLCYIDLPWEFDPQREHPNKRTELWDLYYRESRRWYERVEIVQGLGEERFLNALEAMKKCCPALFE